MPKTLTSQDYLWSSQKLRCEVSNIMAVAKKEAPGAGFIGDRPKILCERHHFHRKTKGIYDKSHPNISSSTPGGYFGGAREWERFYEMARLDFDAAIYATSFGKFQVMGFNYKLAGYASLKEFYDAMFISEGEHLKAFVNFVIARGLDDELRDESYTAFAEGYNGPTYYKNNYDVDIARYDKEYERQGVDKSIVISVPPSAATVEQVKAAFTPAQPTPAETHVDTPQAAPEAEWSVASVSTKVEQIQGQAEKVTQTVETVASFVGKRVDTIKAFRIAMGMKGFGLLMALEGWYSANRLVVIFGLFVIVLFATLYFLRQWHIGVIEVKKKQ